MYKGTIPQLIEVWQLEGKKLSEIHPKNPEEAHQISFLLQQYITEIERLKKEFEL